MTDSCARASSVSIVIPTLNEEENIEPLISQITACAVPFLEILFVDDHSTDNTRGKIHDLARTQPIRFIEQDGADLGLAGAIMSGARVAQGEILLVMDQDLSHPPDRINDLLAPLFADAADLVVGSRYVKGGSTPGWPIWRRIVSRTGAALAYSFNRPARFHVRLLCYWPFPAAGLGTVNQRFQNCLRDGRARSWHATCTRNSHRFS